MDEPTQRIEAKLHRALSYLRAAAPSPRLREYRMRAESYVRAVESWKTLPPREAQRTALGELVDELHTSVLDSARRGSLRALPLEARNKVNERE